MKKCFLIFIFSFIFIQCDKSSTSKITVEVDVVRFQAQIYYFGIYLNDDEVFAATECGTGHPTAEQCVDFNESFILASDCYKYYIDVNPGDKVSVLAVTDSNAYCSASVSTWIYWDGDLMESDVDDGDDEGHNCGFASACNYTF